MKAVIRMSVHEDFVVEAEDEEQLQRWMNIHTIEEAEHKAGKFDGSERCYEDKILFEAVEDEEAEFSIKEELE